MNLIFHIIKFPLISSNILTSPTLEYISLSWYDIPELVYQDSRTAYKEDTEPGVLSDKVKIICFCSFSVVIMTSRYEMSTSDDHWYVMFVIAKCRPFLVDMNITTRATSVAWTANPFVESDVTSCFTWVSIVHLFYYMFSHFWFVLRCLTIYT